MKKKVVIFVPYMTGYGGTETVIKNLFTEYNELKKNEFQFRLISIGGFEDSNWQDHILNKKIFSFSSFRFFRNIQYIFLLPILMCIELIRNPGVDDVVSTNPVMWALAFWIKKIFKLNYDVVSWYHYSPKKKPIRPILLKSADKYFAISSGVFSQFLNLGIDKKNIYLIYNPVLENKKIVKRTNRNAPFNFIYVGRVMLDGQKNLRKLFDCLAMVSGDWILSIYGSGNVSEVKNYAKSKNIINKLKFSGFSSNIWNELDAADCLVLSSKYEGFPMVLVEAISMGIPVLSVDCESGPSDIINSDNGIIVDQDDNQGFTVSLQKFADRECSFNDYNKVKASISDFYGENYLNNFIRSLS